MEHRGAAEQQRQSGRFERPPLVADHWEKSLRIARYLN
jgi:hypothetical protein